MMRAGVLFSGGEDSALAALLLARGYPVVAEGTRLGDGVPGRDEARSPMGRPGCACGCPLPGSFRVEADRPAGRFSVVERGETGRIPSGDYEYGTEAGFRRRGSGPVLSCPAPFERTLVRDKG